MSPCSSIDSAPEPPEPADLGRILATPDGVHTATSDVTGLKLSPDRLPTARIVSPPDYGPGAERTFLSGTNVLLIGSAYDLEDGSLDYDINPAINTMVWSSSLDGALGSGPYVEISTLTVGVHVITLVVTDSADNQASDTIQITVQ